MDEWIVGWVSEVGSVLGEIGGCVSVLALIQPSIHPSICGGSLVRGVSDWSGAALPGKGKPTRLSRHSGGAAGTVEVCNRNNLQYWAWKLLHLYK
jgi:hypothetical protein